MNKEHSGLGLRSLIWLCLVNGVGGCWKLHIVLWYRVLCARYGQEGGRLCVERGEGLVWWKAMRNIRERVGLVDGEWLRDNISRKVGDGNSTLFWVDLWLDGMPLRIILEDYMS